MLCVQRCKVYLCLKYMFNSYYRSLKIFPIPSQYFFSDKNHQRSKSLWTTGMNCSELSSAMRSGATLAHFTNKRKANFVVHHCMVHAKDIRVLTVLHYILVIQNIDSVLINYQVTIHHLSVPLKILW